MARRTHASHPKITAACYGTCGQPPSSKPCPIQVIACGMWDACGMSRACSQPQDPQARRHLVQHRQILQGPAPRP
eukprot:364728-Chlamydomonas_euryale.AAC.4